MPSKSSLPLFAALFAAAFSPLPASAQDAASGKRLSADLVLEWQNEYRAKSDDQDIDETNNSFVRAELAPTLRFNENWFVDGVFVFEPFDQVGEVNAGDDIWFDREGAFIEEIKLNYENGPYAAWAGKFNPGFGRAWDFGRGIWTEDFAEDYEITEKLGVGGSYTFETPSFGEHTVSATTFFADTTILSRGIITSRNDVDLEDGGASNTEDFSSFTISLDGENLAGIENLGYHLGYRSLGEQDKNRDDTTSRESGVSVSVNYAAPVNDNLGFDILAEYAGISNFEGVKDADRDYYSASLITTFYQNWNVTVGGTIRNIDDGTTDIDDHLLQLSAGYDFQNGFTAEAGWRNSRESEIDTDMAGFLLRYQTSF
jgi:hypothetical protein